MLSDTGPPAIRRTRIEMAIFTIISVFFECRKQWMLCIAEGIAIHPPRIEIVIFALSRRQGKRPVFYFADLPAL